MAISWWADFCADAFLLHSLQQECDILIMDLEEPSEPSSIVALGQSAKPSRGQQEITSFDRRELNLINGVYGRMLALGLARDYAIDLTRETAVFSIFRRTSENPLYRVEKRPKDAGRQGAWSVVSASGGILRRGRDLKQVLRVLDQKLLKSVD